MLGGGHNFFSRGGSTLLAPPLAHLCFVPCKLPQLASAYLLTIMYLIKKLWSWSRSYDISEPIKEEYILYPERWWIAVSVSIAMFMNHLHFSSFPIALKSAARYYKQVSLHYTLISVMTGKSDAKKETGSNLALMEAGQEVY